jgi:hypothetical protein
VHVLCGLSTAVRQDPEIIRAAQVQQQREFIKTIRVKHPLQHFEDQSPLSFNLTVSQRAVVEEAFEAMVALYDDGDLGTKDLQLECLAVCWLNSPCEFEEYQGLTNREAAEKKRGAK